MVSCRLEKTTWRILFLFCLLVLLSGCAFFQRVSMPPLPENAPAGFELDAVPFYPQAQYQCGPATLAMALTWSGLPITPDELKAQVYTPARKGSLQLAMVGATRRHGKIAYEINDPQVLFPQIAAGHPVIVLQNLGLSWMPVWHYALVIGYDTAAGDVILRSGTTQRKVMSYGLFDKTWARSNHWGLIVLAPDRIPAKANEVAYLTAVVGLEKARRFQAAVIGYRTALTRWPASLNARMGLGNSYYALGDFKNAEQAFREATELHPRAAAAYNNLAYALLGQGRKQEALVAAQHAVALGGPLEAEFEKTLQEIRDY